MADDRPMMGVRLGTIAGIEVRVNWSVLVIASLVAWSLSDAILPAAVEGRAWPEYWAAGVLTTGAFFAGLLAHELGHSLVARRAGVDIESITLWMFGGVANLERSPESPDDALRIAVAGPAVSVALGAIGLVLSAFLDGLVAASLAWFGLINLLLAGFNLLPAFPMDGGRVYQAWLWRRSGDEVAATERAAGLGRVIGGGLVVLGVLEVLIGGLIGGLWFVVIGMFLREASRAELRHVRVERPLRHVTVADVMSPRPVTVDAGTTISELVAWMLAGARHVAYPVTSPSGDLVGLVDRAAVARTSRHDWPTTSVGDVATPVAELVVVGSSTPVVDLLARLQLGGDHRALVVDEGRLVGIVAPSDIMRLVQLVELTGQPPPPHPPTVGPDDPHPWNHHRAA